jgi:hypothetical protein
MAYETVLFEKIAEEVTEVVLASSNIFVYPCVYPCDILGLEKRKKARSFLI